MILTFGNQKWLLPISLTTPCWPTNPPSLPSRSHSLLECVHLLLDLFVHNKWANLKTLRTSSLLRAQNNGVQVSAKGWEVLMCHLHFLDVLLGHVVGSSQ